MQVKINPLDHERFLAALNQCFGHWGERTQYDWCFARDAGAGPPERFVLVDVDGTWMAGSAIEHRHVVFRGERVRVGIITASWTAEGFRGRGLFTRVIAETRRLIAKRGGIAMIGMGRQENASHSRLVAAGGRVIEGVYAVSQTERSQPDSPLGRWVEVARSPQQLVLLHRLACSAPTNRPRFDYGSTEAWVGQVVDRPLGTEIVSDEHGSWAVIEKSPDTDRICFLAHERDAEGAREHAMRSLLSRAAMAGRKMFVYATSSADQVTVAKLGLLQVAAAVTITPADDAPETARAVDRLSQACWQLDNGDRM